MRIVAGHLQPSTAAATWTLLFFILSSAYCTFTRWGLITPLKIKQVPKAVKQSWDFLLWGRINIWPDKRWWETLASCHWNSYDELFYTFFHKLSSLTTLFSQNLSSVFWTNLCRVLDINWINSVQSLLLQRVWSLYFVPYRGRTDRGPSSEFQIGIFVLTLFCSASAFQIPSPNLEQY